MLLSLFVLFGIKCCFFLCCFISFVIILGGLCFLIVFFLCYFHINAFCRGHSLVMYDCVQVAKPVRPVQNEGASFLTSDLH